MTLQQAKSLRITLRKVRSGDYRVNFRDGSEMTAYCADNLEDDVKTAVEMVRVVSRRFVSIAEVHAIVARAHLAQSEPEMARN